VARTRTTKKLAQRIDLNYFKRPTPLKRAKFWISLLLPLLALVWIAERTIFKDSRVYSSGRLSEPHAILEKECATCHVQTAGSFSSKAADSACLGCHDGPVHHTVSIVGRKELACAECHTEHRGRVDISAASNQSCAECHANLGANGGSSHYASNIHSFENGHPEFAAVRSGARDPNEIKLNHAIHMKQIRRSATGPLVQLDCGDCHRPAASPRPTTYSDANYVGAKVSYADSGKPVFGAVIPLMPRQPITGRELMAPVRFANACAACHLLAFDRRFEEGGYRACVRGEKVFELYRCASKRTARDAGSCARSNRQASGVRHTNGHIFRMGEGEGDCGRGTSLAQNLLAVSHHCARTSGIHGYRSLVCRHSGLGSSIATCCDHPRSSRRRAAANRNFKDHIALDAAREI
jgi:hypothetical protein